MNKRNSKRSRRPAKKDMRDAANKEVKKNDNDASWYTRNTALIADSGKIAFTWPTGIPVDLDYDPGNAGTVSFNGTSGTTFLTPGVCALKYAPTYGLGQDGYDAINIAAQNVYTYVRHVQSGHANYDPSDLMLYLMAMDQVYALYMHLVRAYGSIRLFSQKNRNMPRVLLNAMGFDYDDIAANLANFRYYINNAATRIGAMCVPNNMPIFARHMWMPSGIYSDSPSAKGQFYLFRPIVFGEYNEKTASIGGFLDPHFMDYVHSVSDWTSLLDTLIASVRNSEDCGIMSGDILKAYGENVVKLPFITEDYTTIVSYSPEVLGQIANATVTGSIAYTTVGSITPMFYQDLTDNVLKSAFKIYVASTSGNVDNDLKAFKAYEGKRIMVGLSEQPTPEEVMVNSRLMCVMKDVSKSSSSIWMELDSVGSEIITDMALYSTDSLEGYNNVSPHRMNEINYAYYVTQNRDARITLERYGRYNFLNYHPAFMQTYIDANENMTTGYCFDVDNYAIVDAHDVAKMHDTALLSMLDVPLMGSTK